MKGLLVCAPPENTRSHFSSESLQNTTFCWEIIIQRVLNKIFSRQWLTLPLSLRTIRKKYENKNEYCTTQEIYINLFQQIMDSVQETGFCSMRTETLPPCFVFRKKKKPRSRGRVGEEGFKLCHLWVSCRGRGRGMWGGASDCQMGLNHSCFDN